LHSDARARMEAALYVVATPLGNLRDITLRALDVLAAVDVVATEDTRHTRQLLAHYAIQARLIALHEHNEQQAAGNIIGLLADGMPIAYVTDAGTPAISDPGARLVARVREAGLSVIPIPGPSALTAALSAAGMSAPHFLFYGFLPSKAAARKAALSALSSLPHTLVFFEAPHRLLPTLEDMAQALGPDRVIVIARELTKVFESFHRCSLARARTWLAEDANRVRGEFVLIVEGAAAASAQSTAQTQRILEILLSGLPLKQAVHLAAAITGVKKNTLYERALAWKKQPISQA
jgi:16S rRNA (cytidine1402-2'-O)-methyltransferase